MGVAPTLSTQILFRINKIPTLSTFGVFLTTPFSQCKLKVEWDGQSVSEGHPNKHKLG